MLVSPVDVEAEAEQIEGEEAVPVKHRRTDEEPTAREVEEHNMDHATFRSWCPHCVKGKSAAYGHKLREENEAGVPSKFGGQRQ